ncbi:ABC transporter permease [Rugosimonospora acidiphila]|uniref:Transport permease protein n=1 Tax=Rugosimonospora acidiphila TaxID=556531 RepID=A0ABP9RQK6_9ACTN
MVVAASFGPGVYGRLDAAVKRSGAVTRRNIAALRSAYWLVVISGFFEPLLYLLSIGVGVGGLVNGMALPDGRVVSYAVFVAPSMLASSAMAGALSETTFNFFGKMKYMKLYDGVLATPVRPMEVALGELAWAMVRGSLYSAAFLVIMVVMGLTSAGWALLAFPASLLVGLAFGGLGMALSTFMTSWQDFDLLGSIQLALFLFSGTFAPVNSFPEPIRLLIEATPLYHAVELIRGLTTGSPHPILIGHIGYLVAMGAAGLVVAGRRVGRLLLK